MKCYNYVKFVLLPLKRLVYSNEHSVNVTFPQNVSCAW